MWGKEVSTEPGLFSLCNIFKAFSIEERICPIIGMTMKFIVRFKVFLRLKEALLVTCPYGHATCDPFGRQSPWLSSAKRASLTFTCISLPLSPDVQMTPWPLGNEGCRGGPWAQWGMEVPWAP